MIPGKTTYTEALNILSQTVDPSADNAASISFTLLDNEGRTSLASINFGGDNIVELIRVIPIDLFAQTGTLGDLLAAGLKPNHVYHTCEYLLPVRFLITFGAYDELVTEVFPLGSLAPDRASPCLTSRRQPRARCMMPLRRLAAPSERNGSASRRSGNISWSISLPFRANL